MKAILTIILSAMTFITAGAYKYSYTFDNVPVSEAIVKISKENPDVNISFIYKELDRYLTHARVRTDDAFDALRSVIGIHPISIIRRGRQLLYRGYAAWRLHSARACGRH